MAQQDKAKSAQETKPEMAVRSEEWITLNTRRDFLVGVLTAASGIVVGGIFRPSLAEPQGAAACGATAGDELLDMLTLAVKGGGGKVQGMIRLTNENRAVPLSAGQCKTFMLRYFEGWDATGKKIWPPANRAGLPTPGPTIVVRLGDDLQLTFLNNVNPSDFPGSIDTGHLPHDAPEAGCDVSSQNIPAGTQGFSNLLPVLDTYPNCFHGSNACNLHFHGTHITPAGFGDNVLVMVEPANILPNDPVYKKPFDEIYANGAKYAYGPVDWKTAVPRSWQNKQNDLLNRYDKNTQFRGQRGLPKDVSLYDQNQKALAAHEWPPYQMGAFPNSLQITRDPAPGSPNKMGQAPGTHWYHAHKHGSTAMHLLHGLAGAMIIRGKYDDDLQRVYPGLQEKVLVIQEYSDMPALYRNSVDKAVLLNGQFQPKITMKQGEIQLWRIVNAAQQGQMPFTLNTEFKQIAQDGVQFKAENYGRQPISAKINLFPGNRLDLLVKAPSPGTVCQLLVNGTTVLATVALNGSVQEMKLPDAQSYPIEFPNYLADIPEGEIRKERRLTFGWDRNKGGNPQGNPPGTGRSTTTNAPPHFMIDNKQFDAEYIDQTMELNDYEEWKIENETTIPHPFHIHVNPFQVVEVFDPSVSSQPQKLSPPYVWWDTFSIPPRTTSDGPNGYFKMRTRFADFTGKYVLHCHILGHEDRGMMQVVEVIPKRRLTVPHH